MNSLLDLYATEYFVGERYISACTFDHSLLANALVENIKRLSITGVLVNMFFQLDTSGIVLNFESGDILKS